jgi:hypothetical protein
MNVPISKVLSCLIATMLLVMLVPAGIATAVPTPTVFVDTPDCDPLFGPPISDELGFSPPFPLDERIEATATFTNQPACLPDNPEIPNALVVMTNLTTPPRAFPDVWYVRDRETSLTNVDGLVNGELAFKIDAVGLNRPLVFESIAPDGIFAPGETWHFIIQDYTNSLGLPPFLFDSIGVPSTVSPPSSGSIIAIVPEPTGALALVLGAAAGLVRRRV